MLAVPDIRLAVPQEARHIADLARDTIEFGLSWSWTAARVLQAIHDPSTNVAVVLKRDQVRGFGIMHYGDETGHLALLAIDPAQRHQRLGARLVAWLEQSARAAGIRDIRLETRADNLAAIAFYQRLGFALSGRVAGYYEGILDAVRFGKRLA